MLGSSGHWPSLLVLSINFTIHFKKSNHRQKLYCEEKTVHVLSLLKLSPGLHILVHKIYLENFHIVLKCGKCQKNYANFGWFARLVDCSRNPSFGDVVLTSHVNSITYVDFNVIKIVFMFTFGQLGRTFGATKSNLWVILECVQIYMKRNSERLDLDKPHGATHDDMT